MSLWNLRNYEIFAHRGYYGDNTMDSFRKCVEKGYHIESDTIITSDNVVLMRHGRTIIIDGTIYNTRDVTAEQILAVEPNCVTAEEFLAWMATEQGLLVKLDCYDNSRDKFLQLVKNNGVMDRMMISGNLKSLSTVAIDYPELSYQIDDSYNYSDEELDIVRTQLNIVSANCDNADHRFYINVQWEHLNSTTLPDAIANGATWFVPEINGELLDKFADKVATYQKPGWTQSDMLTRIGNAIRSTLGVEGDIIARNFDSQIRKMHTFGESTGVLNIGIGSTAMIGCALKGNFQDVSVVNIDCGEIAGAIGTSNYLTFKTGTTFNFYGTEYTINSDMFRCCNNIKEINFVDIFAPTSLTRFCHQTGYESKGFAQVVDVMKITGLSLDNLTSLNSCWNGIAFDIHFEGELKTSLNFSMCSFTGASVDSLLNHLYDYNNREVHTLTIGSTLKLKASEEALANATARNWQVV